MKLNQIPEVMLGKERNAVVSEYYSGYNAALTAQGEVEIEVDVDMVEKVILDYLVRTQKERMFKDVIRAREMGKNTRVSESIATALSDNLPSILKVVKK